MFVKPWLHFRGSSSQNTRLLCAQLWLRSASFDGWFRSVEQQRVPLMCRKSAVMNEGTAMALKLPPHAAYNGAVPGIPSVPGKTSRKSHLPGIHTCILTYLPRERTARGLITILLIEPCTRDIVNMKTYTSPERKVRSRDLWNLAVWSLAEKIQF